MVFFQYLLKIFNVFWYFNDPKKSANLFSLKIKGLEKQKCVNKLFLSKSKIKKKNILIFVDVSDEKYWNNSFFKELLSVRSNEIEVPGFGRDY